MPCSTQEAISTIRQWSSAGQLEVSLFFSGRGMRFSFPKGLISGVANTVLAFDCKCGGRLDCDVEGTTCEVVGPESISGLDRIPWAIQGNFARAIIFEWQSGDSMMIIARESRSDFVVTSFRG